MKNGRQPFVEDPKRAFMLHGLRKDKTALSSEAWRHYRETLYNELKNNYHCWIKKFDVGFNNLQAFVHVANEKQANSVIEQSPIKLAGETIYVFAYESDKRNNPNNQPMFRYPPGFEFVYDQYRVPAHVAPMYQVHPQSVNSIVQPNSIGTITQYGYNQQSDYLNISQTDVWESQDNSEYEKFDERFTNLNISNTSNERTDTIFNQTPGQTPNVKINNEDQPVDNVIKNSTEFDTKINTSEIPKSRGKKTQRKLNNSSATVSEIKKFERNFNVAFKKMKKSMVSTDSIVKFVSKESINSSRRNSTDLVKNANRNRLSVDLPLRSKNNSSRLNSGLSRQESRGLYPMNEVDEDAFPSIADNDRENNEEISFDEEEEKDDDEDDNIQSTALTDVCPSTRKNHFSFKVAFEKLLKDGLQECWDPEYDKLSDDFQQFIIYKFIQTYWGVDGEGGDLEKAKQQLREVASFNDWSNNDKSESYSLGEF